MHRDLKPGNFFLTKESIVKIGDFGISKRVRESEDYALKSYLGTPSYMAPEIQIGGEKYTSAVDIWSLGVCIYEFITLKRPWKVGCFTPESVKNALGKIENSLYKELITGMLTIDSKKRLNIE